MERSTTSARTASATATAVRTQRRVWAEVASAAAGVCATAVARKAELFRAYRGQVGIRDLKQEAIEAVRRAWPSFDPVRYPSDKAWSTFAYTVAARRLLTIARRLARQAKRDAAAALPDDASAAADGPAVLAELAEIEGRGGDDALSPASLMGPLADDDTLEDWLGRVYRYASRRVRHDPAPRGGRPFTFTAAQMVAAAMLMRRMGLTSRAAAELFASRPTFRAALRLCHVPSYVWFWRAGAWAAEVV